MKKLKMTNEIKTGLMVFAAILVGLFFWLKTTNLYTATYELSTFFNHADGIKENSIVKLAGIEVGRVKSADLVYDEDRTRVELCIELDKSAKVREDSIAFIGTSGFIGDAFIGITPGESTNFLKRSDIIVSEDPVEMRELMKKADHIASNLDATLADVKGIVSDNKDKVDSIVANLEDTSSNFKEFSQDIKQHPWKLLMKGK